MTPDEALRRYFGYDEFRPGQRALIDAVLRGQDVCGIMPTGAGKSLCYQVPSLILPGVTLVISPLISLMRDQVLTLVAAGVKAAFINSSLTDAQCARAMANARAGQYKIIYIAPERLMTSAMLDMVRGLDISFVAVDEAHCISQWGQDFRPAYLDVPAFIGQLARRPVLGAFTATATARVRSDILHALQLHNPQSQVTGFDRPNLYFSVRQPKDKEAALLDYLQENNTGGIVYCATRKEVDKVADALASAGYNAAAYHAGLPDAARTRAQDDFLHDRVQIIVATNAFGMGIDKSNVRFVIHYNMPQNVEAYYQEAGRAGRDGLDADCLLFFARKDIMTAVYLITRSENEDEVRRNRRLLNRMVDYCESTACLRGYLLSYFGDESVQHCGNCSICIGEVEKPTAQKSKKKKAGKQHFTFSDALFEKCKALRLEIARTNNIPAFVVFSDATLVDMCQKHPLTEEEMLKVSGIGQVKMERYGTEFLQLLQREPRTAEATAPPPALTLETLLTEIVFIDEPIPISRVADALNAVLIKNDLKKTSGMALNKLLLAGEFLEDDEGRKKPTPHGREAGISTTLRNTSYGAPYEQCLFDAHAQRLCAQLFFTEINVRGELFV